MMKEMAAALLLVMLISLSVAEGNFTLQLSWHICVLKQNVQLFCASLRSHVDCSSQVHIAEYLPLLATDFRLEPGLKGVCWRHSRHTLRKNVPKSVLTFTGMATTARVLVSTQELISALSTPV